MSKKLGYIAKKGFFHKGVDFENLGSEICYFANIQIFNFKALFGVHVVENG